MTNQQINIAIAVACGWKQTHVMQMGAKGKYLRTYQKGRGKLHQHLPDYLNDLNAMHEAEMTLPIWLDGDGEESQGTRHHFRHELCLICDQPIHANAAQRAEAFLRTIGKWEEET